MFPLPNPVPGKDNSEPKRPPKALDISKMVKLTPSMPNKVSVKWASDSGKGWVVALNLVENLTATQLLDRLVQKGTSNSSFTKDIIRKKLSDDDDGIATTNIKVTLASCPVLDLTHFLRKNKHSHEGDSGVPIGEDEDELPLQADHLRPPPVLRRSPLHPDEREEVHLEMSSL